LATIKLSTPLLPETVTRILCQHLPN